MTERKARIRGEKKRRLEYAGFKFYQVDDVDDDNHAKWLVEMPTGKYLRKSYVHLTNAISAAERQLYSCMFLYKSSANVSDNWIEAIRRYEEYYDEEMNS